MAEARGGGDTISVLSSNKGSRRIDFHLDSKGKQQQFTAGNCADFRLQTLSPCVNSTSYGKAGANVASSSSGEKSDGHEFLDSGLDPELTFGITIRRIGAGLENLGNTCFLNSVLQCLTYTEPLAAYLQSGKHRISCRIAGFCALCAIQKHVSQALQATGRILAPKDLVSNLRSISRNFRNARQEDAHEYMVHLLESMHKCCIPKGVPSESHNAYEKSLVHKIFGGRLQSQVKCMQCSYHSNTFDHFLDLSLDISKVDSLHKALLNFTATEQLDGGSRVYQCQQCKQKVKATKQLTVYKAPYVLTVHLKRFCAHDLGRKIDKKVHFTPSLNLKPFVSGSYEGDLKYTLYGVLVHAGYSTHSGHYYSFVRTASGTWYRVDDNRVIAVGERTVLDQKAYMLFYYRDRKNIGPRKPVQAWQNEKLAAVGMRNEILSISNQRVKSGVQDVSVGNIFSCDYTSAMVKSCVPKQNQNAPVIAENKNIERATNLELPTVPFVKEQCVNATSVVNPGTLKSEKEQLPQFVPSVTVSSENVCGANSCSASTNVKHHEPKEEESLNKTASSFATTYSDCTTLQKAATKGSTDMTSEKIGTVSNNGAPFGSQIKNTDKTSPGINSTTSPNHLKNESIQVKDVAIGNATSVFPDDKTADDTGLNLSSNGQKESSSSPVLLNIPSHITEADQKRRQKGKKRGPKFQLGSMNLGLYILHRASLKNMRKKKAKLRRKRSLEINNPTEEIDTKPSTSEETRASVHPRKKARSYSNRHNGQTCKEVPSSLGKQLVCDSVTNGELRERHHQYGEVPATDKVTHKRPRSDCCLEVDTCDARDPADLNYTNRKSMQNNLMNMVTRGLEQTIVASWDEVDLPESHGVQSVPREVVSIGYVPDEWDEEYDAGKKKKIRTSNTNFNGKNPFQEIASKKTKLKKLKVDPSRIGNQPFRISK